MGSKTPFGRLGLVSSVRWARIGLAKSMMWKCIGYLRCRLTCRGIACEHGIWQGVGRSIEGESRSEEKSDEYVERVMASQKGNWKT